MLWCGCWLVNWGLRRGGVVDARGCVQGGCDSRVWLLCSGDGAVVGLLGKKAS